MTGQELPSFSKVMISASQLNTYLFCPRLLFLEAVLGCEGSNIPSEEGRFLHDKLATEEVFLESPVLGLCGRIDVYREEGVPIEYKEDTHFQMACHGRDMRFNCARWRCC